MPNERTARSLLVKTDPDVTEASVPFGDGTLDFVAAPLFRSIGRPTAPGVAAGPVWQVLTPTTATALEDTNPWDVCHRLLTEGLGVAGTTGVEFAEPDLLQQWTPGQPVDLALGLAATCDPKQQDTRFPSEPDPVWFHDASHAQFTAALAALGAAGPLVARVAHFDTGYDAAHAALPATLNLSLQRNFVDADRPNDARDVTPSGGINSLGHGTGTIGVLAGQAIGSDPAIGGAPFVEVVPVRVANSVALFYNGAIAAALDYVHALCQQSSTRVDVITMSMGGLASQVWAEAVNAVYDAGVFIVTAAGNNWGNLPTRNIVFPARFNRVVAACGVMANDTAYADLPIQLMCGNYGPPSKMRTAVAGFTPNIPWARFGCSQTIDLDGAGTSCATPQVAAAAAIWIQRHRAALAAYPAAWMGVEATRAALFDTARAIDAQRLGRGELRVADALARQPAPAAQLRAEQPDSAAFPFLRLLTGVGLAEPDARQRMLELEALQLSQSAAIEALLPDPAAEPSTIPPATLARLRDALVADPRASQTLRSALQSGAPPVVPVSPPVRLPTAVERLHLEHATNPRPPRPAGRRLRVYAYDPSLGTQLATLGINEGVISVRWEQDLAAGPIGEYLEVIDVDPASRCCYAPLDLNHPYALVADGLAPSETSPQFQHQMVYAVAMNTIEHFERAIGRVALWSPRLTVDDDGEHEQYAQRLRIYPHALRAANAYYSPPRKALLMGYFSSTQTDAPSVLPGGLVFSALSSDIIAHETTHALLDGLHRRFLEATNPDVLAFHEAFADIVALFQHFSIPGALRQAIATTRGDLAMDSLLAELAVQFGQATGRSGGLRNAIGSVDRDHHFQPHTPAPADYQASTEPHTRGSVLVGAVFDAFLQIYRARTADLIRLASGGSGILAAGALPTDLIERLAQEGVKAARHVLQMCIRGLDYCPPIDITFGEYLRAVITADRDLVPADERDYRVAVVSAFRARGIYPADVKSLSVDSLVWEPPPTPLKTIGTVLDRLQLDWDLLTDRHAAYTASRANADILRHWLLDPAQVADDELDALGLVRAAGPATVGSVPGDLEPIVVHAVRPARRVGPDGQLLSDVVVEITQSFQPSDRTADVFRGGCLMLVGLRDRAVRYFVRKRVNQPQRFAQQQAFQAQAITTLRANYRPTDQTAELFALLHRAGS